MHLLNIDDTRINADHIVCLTDTSHDGETVCQITLSTGSSFGIRGEAAHALLNWWDARADRVLWEYQKETAYTDEPETTT